ncbi:MAG: zinc ABC transporter substrate-binding protein [Actinomycetaceae bacterium]|nr:zinc ABC transporter substrate-binding protein [Actinomycetaceae bacterium]
MRRFTTATVSVATMIGLTMSAAGCAVDNQNSDATSGGAADSDSALIVVATTGYLGDAVANIAPEADVTVLVGPGGDPHTQPLTTQDTEKINNADLVVWTSHDMEHQMMDQFDKLGDKQIPAGEAIPEDQLLPWEEDGQIQGHDPHIWNSPDRWTYVVNAVGDKLSEIDPDNAETYKANADKYNEEILEAQKEAEELLSQIPKENRILITGHDAFNYLGDSFDIEIYATDFVTSESELSAQQIDELAALIAEAQIPVIFQDNLANPEAINHLREAVHAKGWDVEVSDKELFADTLGEAAPVDTYLGAFRYNAEAIAEALTPQN